MTYLDKETVLAMHRTLIEKYGGHHGIRDEGLLDSALNAPNQSFGGVEFFPTVIDKAVRLCIGLTKNHPFFDGNKRIAAMALLVTLDLNNCPLKTNSTELANVRKITESSERRAPPFLGWRSKYSKKEYKKGTDTGLSEKPFQNSEVMLLYRGS